MFKKNKKSEKTKPEEKEENPEKNNETVENPEKTEGEATEKSKPDEKGKNEEKSKPDEKGENQGKSKPDEKGKNPEKSKPDEKDKNPEKSKPNEKDKNQPGSEYPPSVPVAGGKLPATMLILPTGEAGSPQGVTVLKYDQWGPYPTHMLCPQCDERIIAKTNSTPGILTWFCAGILCLVGCCLGCCLIPFCVRACKDIEHVCPNCDTFLGTFHRL